MKERNFMSFVIWAGKRLHKNLNIYFSLVEVISVCFHVTIVLIYTPNFVILEQYCPSHLKEKKNLQNFADFPYWITTENGKQKLQNLFGPGYEA